MKTGVWTAGLLLTLGASVTFAQGVSWHGKGDGPTPVPAASVHLEPVPIAQLGRPELLAEAPPPQPKNVTPPGAFLRTSYEVAPVLPLASASPVQATAPASLPANLLVPVGEVIASTPHLPTTYPDEQDPNNIFAADRTLTARQPWKTAPFRLAAATIPEPAAGPAILPAPDAGAAVVIPPAWSQAQPGSNPWDPGPDYTAAVNPWDAYPGIAPFHQHLYVSAEYLLWWLKGENVPVLLTTSNASDFGILGNPTTRVLFGGNTINNDDRSGVRAMVGWWLNCDGTAIEIGGHWLGTETTNFSANSGQFPVLGRPFFSVNGNEQFSQLVALPGVTTGSATIHAPSTFWGAEANLRHQLCCGCDWRVNGLLGFRTLGLEESLSVTENIQGLSTAPPPFTNQTITVFDSFMTHNQFYGGQVGFDGRWTHGCWSVDGRVKFGLGSTVQTLDINGGQRFVAPDGTVSTFKGGLLALPSNIGHFTQSKFSFVPELTLSVGYQITPHLRGFLGYNFLYWTNVIRPGDQIDQQLNVQQIPNFPTTQPPSNINRPMVLFRQPDFWAQGLLVGLEFTW
jgi:hypothetical protein